MKNICKRRENPRDLQGNDGAIPRVWIPGKLNVVGTKDQESEKGSSCANSSPGIGSTFCRRERGKEVLKDIEPDQSVVNRERDLDKEEIQQARRRERPQSCVQAPNQNCIHDQQDLSHYEVVVDLFQRRRKDEEKKRERDRELERQRVRERETEKRIGVFFFSASFFFDNAQQKKKKK